MLTWLLECRAATAEQRQTGRLVAGLLLIFAGLSLVASLIYVLLGTQQVSSVLGLSLTVVFLLLYAVNRAGQITLAAVSLIAAIMAVVPVALLDPAMGMLSAAVMPVVLVVPMALAGVLLPWRAVPVVALVALLETVGVYNWAGNPVSAYQAAHPTEVALAEFLMLVVLLAAGILVTFYSHQIRQTLQQLHVQNTVLSEQSAREHTLITHMRTTAAYISSSSAEISAAAAQQASGSSEQAAAITEVTATVEELNQTAVQIAEAAASVAAAAEQALVSANRGQEAVRDSIMSMAMIKARVNDITTRILALSEQSQRISEVIDLINTIAAQTHILALNAAVESAGAGEAGQRFGVVAAEVKKLAQRSVAATKDVRAIIAQVQAATAAAVMATEEGLKETDHGVNLAHQSGDANDDIISMVERTAQLANAISLATQQQRTASEQVVATMREVADVTHQAASSSRQTLVAVNQLTAAAHTLERADFPDEPDSSPLSQPPTIGAELPMPQRQTALSA